jgi:hypothetical protein
MNGNHYTSLTRQDQAVTEQGTNVAQRGAAVTAAVTAESPYLHACSNNAPINITVVFLHSNGFTSLSLVDTAASTSTFEAFGAIAGIRKPYVDE